MHELFSETQANIHIVVFFFKVHFLKLYVLKHYNLLLQWIITLKSVALPIYRPFLRICMWNTKTFAMKLVRVPYFNRHFSVLSMSHMLACFEAAQWPGLLHLNFVSLFFFKLCNNVSFLCCSESIKLSKWGPAVKARGCQEWNFNV